MTLQPQRPSVGGGATAADPDLWTLLNSYVMEQGNESLQTMWNQEEIGGSIQAAAKSRMLFVAYASHDNFNQNSDRKFDKSLNSDTVILARDTSGTWQAYRPKEGPDFTEAKFLRNRDRCECLSWSKRFPDNETRSLLKDRKQAFHEVLSKLVKHLVNTRRPEPPAYPWLSIESPSALQSFSQFRSRYLGSSPSNATPSNEQNASPPANWGEHYSSMLKEGRGYIFVLDQKNWQSADLETDKKLLHKDDSNDWSTLKHPAIILFLVKDPGDGRARWEARYFTSECLVLGNLRTNGPRFKCTEISVSRSQQTSITELVQEVTGLGNPNSPVKDDYFLYLRSDSSDVYRKQELLKWYWREMPSPNTASGVAGPAGPSQIAVPSPEPSGRRTASNTRSPARIDPNGVEVLKRMDTWLATQVLPIQQWWNSEKSQILKNAIQIGRLRIAVAIGTGGVEKREFHRRIPKDSMVVWRSNATQTNPTPRTGRWYMSIVSNGSISLVYPLKTATAGVCTMGPLTDLATDQDEILMSKLISALLEHSTNPQKRLIHLLEYYGKQTSTADSSRDRALEASRDGALKVFLAKYGLEKAEKGVIVRKPQDGRGVQTLKRTAEDRTRSSHSRSPGPSRGVKEARAGPAS